MKDKLKNVTFIGDSSVKNTPKDGDGDDGDCYVDQINIVRVSNGWVINVSYEDETELVEVYDVEGSKDDGNIQAIKAIINAMGLDGKIKLK